MRTQEVNAMLRFVSDLIFEITDEADIDKVVAYIDVVKDKVLLIDEEDKHLEEKKEITKMLRTLTNEVYDIADEQDIDEAVRSVSKIMVKVDSVGGKVNEE